MSEKKLVSIYRAADSHQAAILRNLLENEDIQSLIENDQTENTAAQVLVDSTDAERARSILQDWESRLKNRLVAHQNPLAYLPEPMLNWNTQRCLVCREPRHAICPGCEISGVDFDTSEYEQFDGSGGIYVAPTEMEDDESTNDASEFSELDHEGQFAARVDSQKVSVGINPDEVRLMCTVCDKSFKPQYVRHCTKCGYDYGEGVDIAPNEADAASTMRVVIVIGITIGITILFLLFMSGTFG
jgi:hypothetical protein